MVIASNTSLKYKGSKATPEEVGEDLNVRFVLKGTLRRMGEEIRVNAQLVDTRTGFNAWAQRYDRKVSEVFAVQDEVTRSIVNALAIKLTEEEKSLVARHSTGDLKAYDYFQEGMRFAKVNTKETHEQARLMYRKAIEHDPAYGRAYGAMAYTLATDYLRAWTDAPIESLDRALELAKHGVALDDASPQTYWSLGFVHLMRKEYGDAEHAITRALKISPNYADGYGLLALINNHLGRPERALELNNKAMRLNPYYTWEYLYVDGIARYMMGDHHGAITALEKAKLRNENVVQVKLFLAASYVQSGRRDDAQWLASELQVISPTATVASIRNTIPFVDAQFMHDFLEDLRLAGLPER